MAPHFHPIRNAEDFDSLVPEYLRNRTGKLVARLLHDDRYLPGFVDLNTRIGVFIRRDDANEQTHVITKDNYGYGLLVNWAGTLEWKMHYDEGANLDLTNAFPADPQAPEHLYFGRYIPIEGDIFYGQVYEDGTCRLKICDNILLTCPTFEILEYKQPLPQQLSQKSL